MRVASRPVDSSARAYGAKDAWTAFWQDPVQSRCVAGAPEIWQSLTRHWSAFAHSLPQGARVLDLGCGAGAVARELVGSRPDLQFTGIDFARIPLTLHAQIDLLSDTAMENLPFTEGSFAAAVSQFGFEYSNTGQAAREMARVLLPRASISLLVHHADSRIVAANRVRLNVLNSFLAASLRTAFCAGDVPTFSGLLMLLVARHPDDALLRELSRALPSRLARAQRERVAIWTALEDALAPERCLGESLNRCCLAPEDLEQWSASLGGVCELMPADVLLEPDGCPIAWKIAGTRLS